MNAPAQIRESATNVRRMCHGTYQVWRVNAGPAQPRKVTGETMLDVERELATDVNHGDTFLIAETLEVSGKTTLHAVRIRRGKAIGWDANSRRVYAYTADRLLSVAINAFDPVLPWRWTPGADVIGASNFIEGERA